MKKFFLSFLLIFVFVLYTFHERKEQSEINVVLPNNNQKSSGPTGQPIPVISTTGKYKDGEYTGKITDAFYGNIQVRAIIQNGNIIDVQFLQYPNDRKTSTDINEQAMPFLRSEAIRIQASHVDIVSGATDSSIAFRESLASALSQAL